jgi:hypothetical protein
MQLQEFKRKKAARQAMSTAASSVQSAHTAPNGSACQSSIQGYRHNYIPPPSQDPLAALHATIPEGEPASLPASSQNAAPPNLAKQEGNVAIEEGPGTPNSQPMEKLAAGHAPLANSCDTSQELAVPPYPNPPSPPSEESVPSAMHDVERLQAELALVTSSQAAIHTERDRMRNIVLEAERATSAALSRADAADAALALSEQKQKQASEELCVATAEVKAARQQADAELAQVKAELHEAQQATMQVMQHRHDSLNQEIEALRTDMVLRDQSHQEEVQLITESHSAAVASLQAELEQRAAERAADNEQQARDMLALQTEKQAEVSKLLAEMDAMRDVVADAEGRGVTLATEINLAAQEEVRAVVARLNEQHDAVVAKLQQDVEDAKHVGVDAADKNAQLLVCLLPCVLQASA